MIWSRLKIRSLQGSPRIDKSKRYSASRIALNTGCNTVHSVLDGIAARSPREGTSDLIVPQFLRGSGGRGERGRSRGKPMIPLDFRHLSPPGTLFDLRVKFRENL